MRVLPLFSLFVLASFAASGAQALTLRQAIELGLKNSPEIEQAESQKRQSRAEYKEYVGAVFPTIDAVGSGTKQKVSSNVTSASISRDTYAAYLELQQPLYSGGAILAGLDLGQVNRDISEQNFFQKQQQVVKNVISAYYRLARAERLLKASEGNEKTLRDYLARTKKYERIGRTRTMDRLQASSNLTLSEVATENSRNEFATAQIQLATLIGHDDAAKLHAEDNITAHPVTPMPANKAYEQASTNLPDLHLKRLQVKKVEAQNDLELVEDKPNLYLSAALGYRAADRDDLFKEGSEYNSVGLNLRIPLFSGLSSLSKRKANKEERFQAEKDLALTERDVRQSLQNSLKTLQTLYKNFVKSQNALADTQKALDMANRGYNQGVVTSQDVVNFQRNRFEAERQLVETQFDYLQSILDLRQTLGIDLAKVYGIK